MCIHTKLKIRGNNNELFPEKVETEGVEDTEFLGVLKKKYVEIPGVFVFGVRISKGCHTILQNF